MRYNMKKLFIGVISVYLAAACFCTSAFAEDFDYDPSGEQEKQEEVLTENESSGEQDIDVTDTEEKEEEIVSEEISGQRVSECRAAEYSLLSRLGIFKSDCEADTRVTRAEFAELLCRLVKLGENSEEMFSDVTEETSGAAYIQMIAKSGVMVGFEDGTFRPNEGITYAQAVTAILKIAGYDRIAEQRGGYPNGYLSLASEHSLTGSFGIDSALTWEKTAYLFYKALFLNVMSIESISGDRISVAESEKTVLEKFFGLVKGEGLIAASKDIALGGRAKTADGYVVISAKDGEWILSAGSSGIDEYVGYRTVYYYNEDDEVFCFETDSRHMQATEVTEEKYIAVNRSLTELEYEKDSDKSGKLKISEKADFVYNGLSCFEITQEDFEKADCIKLIDYDNDGKYDVVYLEVYDVYFVDSISKKTGIITDKREGIFLTIDENEYDISFFKSGMKTDINIIDEWDVLSVAVSKNDGGKRKMKIVVTSDIIIGKITDISVDDREIGIDGKSFYVSKKVDMSKLNYSDNVIFGMNEYGALVCFKREKSNVNVE